MSDTAYHFPKDQHFFLLATEIWFFFRYRDEVLWSQKCGCGPWTRVSMWHSHGSLRCKGKRLGDSEDTVPGWESQGEKHCPFSRDLEVVCRRMRCKTLSQPSPNVGTLGRSKCHRDAELIWSSNFTDWLNQFQWLPFSRLLIIWEKETSVV